MRIAIVGATGAVGRTLLVHLLKGNDLRAGDELILIGRADADNLQRLRAIRTDLLDAFDSNVILISICRTLEHLRGSDIFIMAAGATIGERITHRSQLACENLALFREIAECASRRCPDAFFLIISNPVELAVSVFCEFCDRQCVMGMGAQQDSLRFARAIAACFNLPRAAVRASVLGEHGSRMVPLWSSVTLNDNTPMMVSKLEALKQTYENDAYCASLRTLAEGLTQAIAQNRFEEAHQRLSDASPYLRILVEPFLTAKLLRSTPNATANATLDCIAAIRRGDGSAVHGQVKLDGDFYGIEGTLGAPVVLHRAQWRIAPHLPLTETELQRLRVVAAEVRNEYTDLLT